jgi:hypothetical protein
MKYVIIPITLNLLIFSLAGCSLHPPSGVIPTPIAVSPSILASGYEPQPGDKNLQRDKVLLELTDGPGFVMTDTDPSQVIADLRGESTRPMPPITCCS